MNTYDFDETIFNPDSSYAFIMYCVKKHPRAFIDKFPRIAGAGIAYALKRINTKTLKENLFSFLQNIDDIDTVVANFWACHQDGIGSWYLAQKKSDDLIISASPEFLLRPVADMLGVGLMGTPMDKKTGKIIGNNCHDKEKVRRFYERFPDGHTENFYSDSLSDTPMAEIADNAFLVKKGVLSPWPGK